ncbi:hypothetical protein DUNSADRAFT_9289 [Dunaliella salina]|uniref:Uncharacterized protein n=1 Tax=Dunaliella salina TaxID=3046 RepID=A0ABQ7GHP1_DUNSA|nr:hypothetical protein DUNSADRAFT_9289 [Dunaliella salina]|eukprot:KAF5834129.1 hypothetical protein DUNSADRAFT_9289 [Dunaliella salina]
MNIHRESRDIVISRVLKAAYPLPSGFGNNSIDYIAPFGKQDSLVNSLKARGFPVYVVQVNRNDWFRVARGLFTIRFWSSTLSTKPGYTWYLKKVNDTIEEALQETGAEQVDLIGHSAGGWLGRAFIGDPDFFPAGTSHQQHHLHTNVRASSSNDAEGSTSLEDSIKLRPNPRIRSLITLGSPQKPPPADRVKDVTGGAVGWVHSKFPGAYFADQGVSYISVCGLTVKGRREVTADGKVVYDTRRARHPYEYAYDSYNQVCAEGQGTVGDAVVPLQSAYLAGARQLVIPGVWHSMSRIGTFEDESGVVWYGSDSVVDTWLSAYLEEAYGKSA